MKPAKENIIEEFYGFIKYLLPIVNKFRIKIRLAIHLCGLSALFILKFSF